MDVKVTQKEEVLQPSGASEEVLTPNVIDFILETETVDGVEVIKNCETVDDKPMLEQQCVLASIFQRGLDPVELEDGIRWSEAIREDLSILQLIQDITEAVAKVSSSVTVTFDTVEDVNGQSYLSYKITEVV